MIQLDPTRDIGLEAPRFQETGEPLGQARSSCRPRSTRPNGKNKPISAGSPFSTKLRDDLRSKDAARRARAERELGRRYPIHAPCPMIWRFFFSGSERLTDRSRSNARARSTGPAASNAPGGPRDLSALVPEVQRRAFESLVSRDLRDILTRLIGLIRKPFKYQVRPVDRPGVDGRPVRGRGEIQRSAHCIVRCRSIRRYCRLACAIAFLAVNASIPRARQREYATACLKTGSARRRTPASIPSTALAAQVASAAGSSRDLQAGIGPAPARSRRRTRRCSKVSPKTCRRSRRSTPRSTSSTTASCRSSRRPAGRSLGVEPEKWKSWWTDQLGYAFQASQPTTKPTFTEIVDASSWSASLECFGEGTLVHAAGGPKAIETIQVGDRVLSQNTATGVLAYQPVMVVHRTEICRRRFRIAVEGETIVATGIHRFWKAGKGWTMARDLRAGRSTAHAGKLRRGSLGRNRQETDLSIISTSPKTATFSWAAKGMLGARLQLCEAGSGAV